MLIVEVGIKLDKSFEYYDNKDYYKFDLDIQRKMLINELNSYGFDFNYDILGLDKLRTIYYGKEMYSKNQNG